MKILIISFLISFSIQAQSFIPFDKQLHIGSTYIIASSVSAYTLKRTQDKRKAILIGIGAGMTIGLAKEIYDIQNGNPEMNDLLADLLGSTLGAIVVTIPLGRKHISK